MVWNCWHYWLKHPYFARQNLKFIIFLLLIAHFIVQLCISILEAHSLTAWVCKCMVFFFRCRSWWGRWWWRAWARERGNVCAASTSWCDQTSQSPHREMSWVHSHFFPTTNLLLGLQGVCLVRPQTVSTKLEEHFCIECLVIL